MKIRVVAASSAVPKIELADGVLKLREEGFDVWVDPRVNEQHFTYAGSDPSRAAALWDAASSDADIIWLARGGYGATRILPLLHRFSDEHGIPARKLLVGYSDVTALHEFVRNRWNWATLHAPMPAAANFGKYDDAQWRALIELIHRRHPGPIWSPLKWMTAPANVEGELIGGNLCLWAAMTGTAYPPTSAAGKILFFEDTNEKFYRLDRMVTQIRQAGLLEGAKAILLGDFTNCDDDEVMMVRGTGGGRVPLRERHDLQHALLEIFGDLGIPVGTGLPVGHGPGFAPLPLGARYRAGDDLELLEWNWVG